MTKKLTSNQLFLRYGLVGGAVGLYFGLFFRPMRQPDLSFTLLLAFAATVVLVCIRAIRERPAPVQILKGALGTFLKTFLLLLMLDARHVAYALGGRAATTVLMTAGGAIAGLWYAYDQLRREGESDSAAPSRKNKR